MRRAFTSLFVLAVLVLLPAAVRAQGTLSGTVKDDSGAVLPGVAVEASSPALIEKTRDAVTDGSGQYRIIDLQPGTYALTFTLPGFSTVKRDGLRVAGSATVTVPVTMKVGGVQETITVTGGTPVVNVQSTNKELVLDAQTIEDLPATRAAGALLNATPGIQVGSPAQALSPAMTAFYAHSSTINSSFVSGEGHYSVNGLPVVGPRSAVSSYVYDTVNAEEITISLGGGLGENDIGGPRINIIPKSGGNTFSGSGFANTAGKWSSSNNVTDEVQKLNPNLDSSGVVSSYDYSASLGGPIVRDRLWFFGSYRTLDTSSQLQGIQANANAGDASRWDWVGAPIEARLVQGRTMFIGRAAAQLGKNRFRVNSEYQKRCEGTPLQVGTKGCHTRGANWIGLGNNAGNIQMSPEATSTASLGYFDVPIFLNQGTWAMAVNNKLLLDAGLGVFRYQPIFGFPPPDGITNLIPVTEQSNAINPATGLQYAPVANFRYRGVEQWGPAHVKTNDVGTSASYVTGSNSLKIGYQYHHLDQLDKDVANQTQLGYRFNRGVPNAVSYYLPDFGRRTITMTQGVYAQDSWTRDRLTLQAALRWDRASSFAPVELNGTRNTSFLNPQPVTIERTAGVDAYNDLSPRVGVAYDVFANGKTAVKLNWGRYLARATNIEPYTSTNPGFTVVRNVQNRGWQDFDQDLIVDCNLLNPAINGECAAAIGNAANFGKLGAATQVNPSVLSGWGVRPHDNNLTATLQQQILPNVAGEFSYTHRRFHGFFVTDDMNRNVNTDYESYTVTAPQDARLPGGGGYPITVLVPTVQVPAKTFLTRETDFGPERKSTWDGFDVTFNARIRQGLRAQIGTSTGRGFVDTCATVTKFNNVSGSQEAGPDPRGCHNVEPWRTTLRGLASYTVPKVDVLVSATLRSEPSVALAANWQVPNSVIAAALGHLPLGTLANGRTTIPITDSEHRLFADERQTQIDMRFAKVLRFGRTRANVGIDLYNLLNENYGTAFNNTYVFGLDETPRSSGFGTPTAIASPRFVRLNFTFDF